MPRANLCKEASGLTTVNACPVDTLRSLCPIHAWWVFALPQSLDGGTLFDRSLIYVLAEFGRSKERPAGSRGGFGTGHHVSNGVLLVSPMLKGNAVYGGVDPDSLLTHGVDLTTGVPTAPEPGLPPNAGQVLREGHIYSLLAQAMGVDFEGRYDMSLMIK